MLSFMREQDGQTRDLGPKDQGPKTKDQNSDVPDLTSPVPRKSGTSDENYVAIAVRGKQVRKTTYLLIVLFGIGLLCLWFMIRKSALPSSAVADSKGGSTEDAQIETAITRLTGIGAEMFNRMGEIVNKFYQFSDVQQVNVDELVKNPFELEDRDSSLATRHLQDAGPWAQGHDMQLLSIVRSEQGNCCMIDDRILYEGDSIRDFKVRQIGDDTVSLQNGDVEVVLKLLE
jgi:hypothetical protein